MLPSAARRVLISISLAASLAACGGDVAAPMAEPYVTSFDRMWTTADRQYSYFALKRVDWDSVYRAARPRALAVTNDAEFIDLAADVLSSLHDVHVWVVAPDGTRRGTWRSAKTANWSPAAFDRQRRASDWVNESPALGHRVINGVPYLALRNWSASDISAATFDRALEHYRNAGVLILDARMNAGGDEDVAMQVAARFADMPRVVTHSQFRAGAHRGDYTPIAAHVLSPRGTWRFTRPVILLVGRGSWSATESFVSAMREFPQVTVVGDTTGGGTGNPALYSLRAGWGFSLSRWIEYTARMETIEGRGIAPDLAVPVKIQSLAKGRDETLATALVMAKHLAARANPR